MSPTSAVFPSAERASAKPNPAFAVRSLGTRSACFVQREPVRTSTSTRLTEPSRSPPTSTVLPSGETATAAPNAPACAGSCGTRCAAGDANPPAPDEGDSASAAAAASPSASRPPPMRGA